ncbi:MAG: hypothetical protein DMG41_27265 [Acidobacteria bacterium]|nr:MAG: hypothetical protein DMG42_15640 [Acidobacteriota bacterium]PYT84416.1 MAG: hypothetical protein DMG41_27265 [Acidobacteriota bacterium]
MGKRELHADRRTLDVYLRSVGHLEGHGDQDTRHRLDLSAHLQDKDGSWLDGANTYPCLFPPNVPAALFWSMAVCDTDTIRARTCRTPYFGARPAHRRSPCAEPSSRGD